MTTQTICLREIARREVRCPSCGAMNFEEHSEGRQTQYHCPCFAPNQPTPEREGSGLIHKWRFAVTV